MKKLIFAMLALLMVMAFGACNNGETYADQKNKERSAINKYIADSAVKVISETDFANQGYTTDVSKNEFVLFENSGVYMQIVREGCGEKLKDGENATILCRFTERNLMTDTITLSNNYLNYAHWPDKMTVSNTSGSFEASFIAGSSLMYTVYGNNSTTVPSGWLVPLTYIKVGRQSTPDEEIAKVRLIIPHSSGHQIATQNVTPYLYDITYERGR